jgi:pSer/pThr/pTyr-binding forkhead associated (FHA) protein
MSLVANLVAVGGDTSVGELALALPAVVGRSKQANVRLTHPLISRKHCEFSEAEGRVVVRDLGSLNGTLVNGERIANPTVVQPGDKVTIGSIVFRVDYTPAGDKPLPAELVDSRRTVRARETTITASDEDEESSRPLEDDAAARGSSTQP